MRASLRGFAASVRGVRFSFGGLRAGVHALRCKAFLLAHAAPAPACQRLRLARRLANVEAPAFWLAGQPAVRVGELVGLVRRPPRPARELAAPGGRAPGSPAGAQGFGGSLRRRV
ncbi:MAG: hypothetical protein JNK06_03990 [Candidatus Accumulibacter phosphatis]|uniref:hypothetical protein n=1 Tax=Candidatus Accumulibacter phosphatis TaxID=327160 RepID=UPI001A409213|nr:hypothetical protein [Candidatus Accumulibacter phosphatis]